MTFLIDTIFLPSVAVDMVMNINSEKPYSCSSIIYDVDFDRQEMIIAHPLTGFSKKNPFKELHLTTIFQDRKRKLRVGVRCSHVKLIDGYALANKTQVPAVLLKYELPVEETNIRSAFRLPLTAKYIIKGKMIYNSLEYHTTKDFSIRNVSLTGLGIIIPQKKPGTAPLNEIKIDEEIVISITLVDTDQDRPAGSLAVKTRVTRVNDPYSEGYTLVGMKILNLQRNTETLLNKFIHSAQIDELKRLGEMGS